MSDNGFVPIYGRFQPRWNLPVPMLWVLAGGVMFALLEIERWIQGDTLNFMIVNLVFTTMFIGMPLGFLWISSTFTAVFRQLSSLAWQDEAQFEQWLLEKQRLVFGGNGRFAQATILTVALLGIGTWFGIRLSENLPLFLPFVLFLLWLPFSFIGGHGLQMALRLLDTLREVTERPMQVPFFQLPPPAVTQLLNFYSEVALLFSVAYGLMAVGWWQSNIAINTFGLFWITALAFFPLGTAIATFWLVGNLLRRLRDEQLAQINAQVVATFAKLEAEGDAETAVLLSSLMEIQKKVGETAVVPIELRSVVTFLVAGTAALVQTGAAIVEIIG